MSDAFLYAGVRTPFGRYAGALAASRPDDLAATVVREVVDRAPGLDPADIDDVILGCANGAGEDNRNVARMAVLPMRVFLGPQGDALAHTRQSAYADRDGRFEFPAPMRGEVRLWLLPQSGGDDDPVPPFVTPPFLV